MNLHDRAEATRKTLDRYRGKAFDWSKGVTCAHMARAHLRNMKHKAPAMPRFRSAFTAKKALKEMGHKSFASYLDALLPRIVPAQMLVGDFCMIDGEDGLQAIFICTGPRTMFGWSDTSLTPVPAVDVQLDKLTGVWRV